MVDKPQSSAPVDIRKAIEPDQSLFKYSALALIGTLLGILVSAALLYTLIISGSNRQLSETVFRYQANIYAKTYSDALIQMQEQLQHLSTHPEILSALQNIDSQALTELNRSVASSMPHLANLQILPFGAIRANPEQTGLSFAALDMINKAEGGARVPAEVHSSNGRQNLSLVQAVKSPTTNAIIGAILAIYEMQALTSLPLAFDSNDGSLQLEQSFPNSASTRLLSFGPEFVAGMPLISAPVASSYLNVNFQPSKSLSQRNSLPALHFWLPIVLSAVAALAFILFSYVRLRNAVRGDAIELVEYSRQLIGDEQPTLPKFQLSLFFSMAKTLSHTDRETPLRQAAAEPEKQKNSPSNGSAMGVEELLDTELQDEDILDLDLVGLNAEGKHTDPNLSENRQQIQSDAALANVPREIFRAYDIRGIVDETLDTDIAYRIGQAISTEAARKGETSVVVGADGRLSSPELSAALIQGLRDAGSDVINIGMVPTPLVYYATHNLDTRTGVMITGSHNPANYNGFKIVIAGETLANDAIQGLYQRILRSEFNKGSGDLDEIDIVQHYIDRIVGDVVVAKPLKVVVDCGNGVAAVVAPRLLEAMGCEVIPLYCEIDGRFPNHHPDPGKPENLRDVITAVKEHQADIGIAFDGDGDRVGVVTDAGHIVFPDRLLMLFAKDVVLRNPGADIIYDVKCSRLLADLISSNGGRPIMWKTGHSLIKAKMRETGALLAGEMSGHIFFKERWFGFDDGLYSACRLLEILSLQNRDAEALFNEFPDEVSTPEINIKVTEESKFTLIETLRKQASFEDGEVITIDGLRVDFANGWGLVRASNTTPVLVLRFAAETEEDLAQIQARFKQLLLAVDPKLDVPF